MADDIIAKLKRANLLGRGGAAYPTWQKWQAVLGAKGEKTYIICNAAEGEPDVHKDGYILNHYAATVVEGIKLALQFFPRSQAIIYLNQRYYKKYKPRLAPLIKNLPITLFAKPKGYIAGEETTILAAIEKRRLEPSLKPPFPSKTGLFGCPTLINNVETFYFVAKIYCGDYQKTAFWSIAGVVKHHGVFELPFDATIKEVLERTKNYPDFDFFLQASGISGQILLPPELAKKISGLYALKVFNRQKTDEKKLLKSWARFFFNESCGKCAPCREGTYRLLEVVEAKYLDITTLADLCFALEKSSFCALGRGAAAPFLSAIKKLL